MYLESFGLKENPFSLVTDPRLLYYSESHCDAMAHLLHGVRERKGIILMLGEATAGKPTLSRATVEMTRATREIASVVVKLMTSFSKHLFEWFLRGFGLYTF